MIIFFHCNLIYNDTLLLAILDWVWIFKAQKRDTIADFFFSVDRDNKFF